MELSKIKQRLELLYQEVKELEASGGGGEPVDAYTKTESDNLFETKSHASDTYQTKSAMSAYATTEWVGEQGFLTDADEVPAVTSNDNGKVLTATYSEGTGSYSWETPSSIAQVQADWTEADSADPSYIKNKPDLSDMATKTWVGSQNYLTSTDLSGYATETWVGQQGYLTSSAISDMATQTWVGQQGFLTSADEVPPITSSDGGKFLRANYYNATGTSDYSWENVPTPSGVEMTSNKVTSLSNASTDTQYPSAKCVYDLIGDVESILATLTTPSI